MRRIAHIRAKGGDLPKEGNFPEMYSRRRNGEWYNKEEMSPTVTGQWINRNL